MERVPEMNVTGIGQPKEAHSRHGRVLLALGTVGAFAVLAAMAFVGLRHRNPPPPSAPTPAPMLVTIPRFTFLDQKRQVVTDATFQGKVWIADFIFLACQTSCPKLTSHMRELQTRIEARKLPVHLVSISVDPDDDTPERLAEYAERWHAHDEVWSFLSGKSEDLDRVVVRGFKVEYGTVREDASVLEIMHGDWFVLVDKNGRIRGYYDSSAPGQLDKLLRTAEDLAINPG